MKKSCLYVATITYLDLQDLSAETYILGASEKPSDAKKYLYENLEGKLNMGYRKTGFDIRTWGWTFQNPYVKIKAEIQFLYL